MAEIVHRYLEKKKPFWQYGNQNWNYNCKQKGVLLFYESDISKADNKGNFSYLTKGVAHIVKMFLFKDIRTL